MNIHINKKKYKSQVEKTLQMVQFVQFVLKLL